MTSASKQEPLVSESAYIRQAKLKGEDPKEIRIKCPFCAEQILIEAKICRFCGKDLPIQEVAPPKVFEPSQLPPLMLERLKEADLLLSCGKKSGALASYVAITRAFPDFPEGWLRIEFMDNATPVLRAEVAKNLERLQALTT